MKLVLKENLRYTELITKALTFAESCLKRTDVLYPFGIILSEGEAHCVFVDEPGESAPSNMIEKLETQIALQTVQSNVSMGIITYSITVIDPDQQKSDALMLSISDSSGNSTMTIYPYTHASDGIKIGKPYTCDLSS